MTHTTYHVSNPCNVIRCKSLWSEVNVVFGWIPQPSVFPCMCVKQAPPHSGHVFGDAVPHYIACLCIRTAWCLSLLSCNLLSMEFIGIHVEGLWEKNHYMPSICLKKQTHYIPPWQHLQTWSPVTRCCHSDVHWELDLQNICTIAVFNGGWAIKWTTQLWDEVGSVVMGDTDGEVVLTGLGSVTFTDGITFLKHSRVFTFNRVRYVT